MHRSSRPGPSDRTVRAADGQIFHTPADWELLPPGDAGRQTEDTVYSVLLSERMKDVAAREKASGKPVNGSTAFGKKRNDRGRQKEFEDHPTEVELAARIVRLHDGSLSYETILEQLERESCTERSEFSGRCQPFAGRFAG